MPVYTEQEARSHRYWLEEKRPGELGFIDEYARKTGGPILELASGAARVTKELALRGHTVYGVEMSRPMVDMAREVLATAAPEVRDRVHLVQGDMTRFAFKRQFPLIVIPFNSFWTNLDEDGAAECVRCMVEHLADGGFFLVESESKVGWRGELSITFWKPLSKKLGFRFRYEKYVMNPQKHTHPTHSFLVGWRA